MMDVPSPCYKVPSLEGSAGLFQIGQLVAINATRCTTKFSQYQIYSLPLAKGDSIDVSTDA